MKKILFSLLLAIFALVLFSPKSALAFSCAATLEADPNETPYTSETKFTVSLENCTYEEVDIIAKIYVEIENVESKSSRTEVLYEYDGGDGFTGAGISRTIENPKEEGTYSITVYAFDVHIVEKLKQEWIIDIGDSVLLSCGAPCIPESSCHLCPEKACPAAAAGYNDPETGEPVYVCGKNPNPICQTEDGEGIKTDFGCIPAFDTNSLVAWLVATGSGIAGAIALIIISFAAYRVMTSAGDAKHMAEGRDMVIAVVSGIVLMVLSVFLLRFIGVNVLGLF